MNQTKRKRLIKEIEKLSNYIDARPNLTKKEAVKVLEEYVKLLKEKKK